MIKTTSIYERILGDDFQNAPDKWRAFHSAPEQAVATGEFEVERGQNLVTRFVAWVMGMPPAADRVSIRLTVRAIDDGEIWQRDFDGKLLTSTQHERAGKLVERFGPTSLDFDLKLDEMKLTFDLVRCRLFGIPLPRFLWPKHDGWEILHENGWDVNVAVYVPFFGKLVGYRGTVSPEFDS